MGTGNNVVLLQKLDSNEAHPYIERAYLRLSVGRFIVLGGCLN